MKQLIGVTEFARLLGVTRQSVLKSGKRALNPNYRGQFPKPDAIDEKGQLFWQRETAEKYKQERNTPAQP